MKITQEIYRNGWAKVVLQLLVWKKGMQIMLITIALTQKDGTVHLLALTPVQLNAILQVDLNSLQYLSPDFSYLSDSKENQSNTSALGNCLLMDL